MRHFLANIQWISYDKGGRKALPNVGTTYFPHIVLDKDIYQTPWSIAFSVVPCEHDGKCLISFRMLVDNEGTRQFCAGITPGNNFRLFEGKQLVAKGTIV